MPSRNTVKEYVTGEYYHIYNRGVEKRIIFIDNTDHVVFLGLIKKYLTGVDDNKSHRHKFESLVGQVELVAFCLMPNHYHLLFRQLADDGITKLMRRVMTGYVMYFNNKYGRVGTLFQGRYKASHINADAYLHHISRYIHLNPSNYQQYPYSSLPYYLGAKESPSWLNPRPVLELFKDAADYEHFLLDYTDTKQELTVLKWQLASDPEDT